MKAEEKRYGVALGTAVAIHVLAALVIGIFGYRFVTRPPEILEVALVGGGGGGAPEQVEEQQENSILRSIDDIIDKRLRPETKKVVTKKTVTNNTKPGPTTSESTGSGNGSAGNSSSGTGNGTGSGDGSGSGDGVGDGRGVPVTPPRIISAAQPKYPSSARSAGVEGVVGVKMLVNANGKVEEAKVVRSSGNGALDEAALAAVYKWRFTPAKDKFGQKAPCYVTQGIRFDLKR
ncbi:MAG: energy transducer TonB [Phascolarctobacterium sp.]